MEFGIKTMHNDVTDALANETQGVSNLSKNDNLILLRSQSGQEAEGSIHV